MDAELKRKIDELKTCIGKVITIWNSEDSKTGKIVGIDENKDNVDLSTVTVEYDLLYRKERNTFNIKNSSYSEFF